MADLLKLNRVQLSVFYIHFSLLRTHFQVGVIEE